MSSQKFIARNRAPRVHLEYQVALYGAQKATELPFVVGVMSDLCGNRREPLPGVADRKFVNVSIENLDDVLKALEPRAAFQVPDTLSGAGTLDVDLVFESMDDFWPAAVVRKVAPLRELGEARQRLANLVTYMDGKTQAELLVEEVLRAPDRLRALADTAEQRTNAALADVLATAFKPQSERARDEVQAALRTMAAQALKTPPPETDVFKALHGMIASMDALLSRQLVLVLHHAAFQELESAWRGLQYLVNNTETNDTLKIRVLCLSKKELQKTLRRYKGDSWDQSPIFKKLYENEFGQLGGEPYGCLVGDYHFDHSPLDVETLGELSKVCQAIQAPFLAGAAPSLLGFESWQELGNPRDLSAILQTPDYAGWRSLRDSDDSRYLGLAMPRCLARLPYGARNPVEEFDFEEVTTGFAHSGYVWANSAYALAANITRAFSLYGWCARIRGFESGGAVEGLPSHAFPSDDGSVDVTFSTEVGITDRREAELAKLGFLPLVHKKNSDVAFFVGAQSLHKPPIYDDLDLTAAANLAARLPYLFATARFAHYVMCIARDFVGAFKGKEQYQQYLGEWLRQYVDGDPSHSSEESKARKPLAAAEIVIEDDEARPGYVAKLFLRPHYQLEGLTVSQRVIVKLPTAFSA